MSNSHTFFLQDFVCTYQACVEDDQALVIEKLIEITETEPAKLEKAASRRFF